MVRVETEGRSLRILVGDRTVAEHSPTAPLFSTGISMPEVRDTTIGRSFRSRGLPTKPLPHAEWDEERSTVTFSSTRRWLRFVLAERDGAAELRLDDASQDFGRVVLHLHGSEKAEVRGGGDAAADGLRGRRTVLWAADPGRYGGVNIREALGSHRGRSESGSAAPQPLFHDSDGYFAAAKHAGGLAADVSRSGRRDIEFWGLPESIFLGCEESAEAIYRRSALLGAKRGRPPRWSIEGVTVGVVGGEEELLLRLDRAVRGGARPSAVYIRDWSGVGASGAVFEDYTPSAALYPRMSEMLERLRARGIQGIARVTPLLSVDGEGYAEAAAGGYLLLGADGMPALSDRGGMTAHLDLENPEARAWAAEKLRRGVFGRGFAAVQAECAEVEPANAASIAGRASLFHNRRAARWIEVCREAAEKSGGTVFASSGAGLGLADAGEVSGVGADWELGVGLRSVLGGLLGLADVGVGVAYCDAGAQFHRTPKELRAKQLVRWAELAAFTPHFRLPALKDDFVPLEQSDMALVWSMARLHSLLAPYIAVCINEFVDGGLPPIRRTEEVYPELKGRVPANQFMLGRDLIVAPVCDIEQGAVEVALPEGSWVHLMSGGDYIGAPHTVESLPGNPAAFFRRDGGSAGFFRSIAEELE